MEDKKIFNTKNCVGCRTCEIACSYHHRKVFSPRIASIEVIDKPGDLELAIIFYRNDKDGHSACDACKGLDESFCVKYCNILMRDELRSLLDQSLQNI